MFIDIWIHGQTASEMFGDIRIHGQTDSEMFIDIWFHSFDTHNFPARYHNVHKISWFEDTNENHKKW